MPVSNATTFERAKAPLQRRQQRRPEESTLYSLVYHHYEELLWCWEDRFQQQYGFLRSEVRAAFESYLNCGIVIHGCALAECEACSHSELIAFSYKQRGLCASCDAKRSVLFAEHLYQNVLLAYPTSHIVFTVPKRLRVYFKYNRKLTKHLYTAAWKAWCELIDDALPGMSPSMISSLHTAGDLLNFHPHVHGLALDGALGTNGHFHTLEEIDPVHGSGSKMKPGMIFTIEPMIVLGTHATSLIKVDGWTVRTQDGKPSAQWEAVVRLGRRISLPYRPNGLYIEFFNEAWQFHSQSRMITGIKA